MATLLLESFTSVLGASYIFVVKIFSEGFFHDMDGKNETWIRKLLGSYLKLGRLRKNPFIFSIVFLFSL